jgi:hypothetical protein
LQLVSVLITTNKYLNQNTTAGWADAVGLGKVSNKVDIMLVSHSIEQSVRNDEIHAVLQLLPSRDAHAWHG